jgi:hypothetical protein
MKDLSKDLNNSGSYYYYPHDPQSRVSLTSVCGETQLSRGIPIPAPINELGFIRQGVNLVSLITLNAKVQRDGNLAS